jgi:hypothetical protein
MDHNFNPVEIAVLALSVIFSKPLADILGSTAVIIAAAAVGAGWALSRQSIVLDRIGVLKFFARIVLFAFFLTALAAEVISRMFSPLAAIWFIGPIALTIGIIGDNWNAIGQWLIELGARWIKRRIGD